MLHVRNIYQDISPWMSSFVHRSCRYVIHTFCAFGSWFCTVILLTWCVQRLKVCSNSTLFICLSWLSTGIIGKGYSIFQGMIAITCGSQRQTSHRKQEVWQYHLALVWHDMLLGGGFNRCLRFSPKKMGKSSWQTPVFHTKEWHAVSGNLGVRKT